MTIKTRLFTKTTTACYARETSSVIVPAARHTARGKLNGIFLN